MAWGATDLPAAAFRIADPFKAPLAEAFQWGASARDGGA